MTVRMAAKTLHLSVTDQNAARCFISTLQIFPFPDDINIEAAVKALAEGLRVTLQTLPFLAGTVGPADPITGKLSVSYPTKIPDLHDVGLFRFEKLTRPRGYPHTYEQLKASGMPPSAFPGRIFCPEVLRDKTIRGIPQYAEGLIACKEIAPILAVQAFFFSGGMVLSCYLHHNVVDFQGVSTFWQHFAYNVRRQTDSDFGLCCGIAYDQSALRTLLDAHIPQTEVPPTADTYRDGVFTYSKTLPQDSECTPKLFVFSAQRIRDFRDGLVGSGVKTDTRMTICNALAALVWIHVTRARQRHLHPHTKTNLGIAVDLRKRMEPEYDQSYTGNMSIFAKVTRPIADFTKEDRVTEATIIPAIQTINRTISNVNPSWANRHLAFFKAKTVIKDTEPTLAFRFGPDMYITSWLHFGADNEWKIPGTASSRPEFIRRTLGKSDGGVIFLPRRHVEDAPYEVLVPLAKVDMDRLVKEKGGLADWAERIVE